MNRIFGKYWQIIIAVIIIFVARYFIHTSFLNEVMILSIFVTSFSFLLYYGDLLSFGQPLYLGVGAYTTAMYLVYFGQNPLIGILIGLIAGLICACVVGLVILQLRSSYFALANAALNVIGYFLAYDVFEKYTNGLDGMWFLTRINPVFGIDLTIGGNFFIFLLLIFMIVLLITKRIRNSMFCTICLAAKTDEIRLRFLGYSIFKIKYLIFIYATLIASLAGSLYAVYFGFVGPSLMQQARAGEIVATGILGSVSALFGPFLGALIITTAKDLVTGIIQHWEVFVGALMVIIVLTAEQGLIALINGFMSKLKINIKIE